MFSNFRMRPFGEFPLSQDDSNMDLAQEGMLLTRCPMCGYKTSTAARKVPRFADVFRLIWRV